ncbi:MAG TPA: hypothetical protein VK400_06175 [Pyrinomonadaceae bacterium]|nr:hypothetical protein [Pyrinomonadaceae bacterium]
MLLMNLIVHEELLHAEQALRKATCDNIIELCEKYIGLLTQYRDELYKLRGAPEINLQTSSPLAREIVEQTRKAVRAAIETTTRERNDTEALIKSFTEISGYEAAKTFNQLEYKGFSEWELRANEIRPKTDTNNERIKIAEAVEIASLLRREAYIAYKTTVWH